MRCPDCQAQANPTFCPDCGRTFTQDEMEAVPKSSAPPPQPAYVSAESPTPVSPNPEPVGETDEFEFPARTFGNSIDVMQQRQSISVQNEVPETKSRSPTVVEEDNHLAAVKKLGKLRIKTPNRSSLDWTVKDVEHTHHVEYDKENKMFKGLPDEWAIELKKQFGIPPKYLASENVRGYDSNIPIVLLQLKDALIDQGGLLVKGIFRLAPDAVTCENAKKTLDAGSFPEQVDPILMANLIKIWYRDMPSKLFSTLEIQDVIKCTTPEKAINLLMTLKEPKLSLALWLLDVCKIVVKEETTNAMTAKNMSIVIAPNLYKLPQVTPDLSPEDGMRIVQESKSMNEFVENAIKARCEV